MTPHYKLYGELASWWPLLSRPEDYVDDAECVWRLLAAACREPPTTLLELGSGGGNTASHLKKRVRLTLVDQSESMLDVSRKLNPECEHIAGDMTSIRINRMFDAVYIHDAIMYLRTQADLQAAIGNAVNHCRPGGAVLFLPDFTRETFIESSHCGGHDQEGLGLRYLQWDIDHDPTDTEYSAHFVYLLRDASGALHTEVEQHNLGLFTRQTWLHLISQTGCRVSIDRGPGGNEIFVGVKA